MKKAYSIFFLFFFFMACKEAKKADEEFFSNLGLNSKLEVDSFENEEDVTFQMVSPNQLDQLLTLDKAYLIDCRSAEEFKEKRIGNAIHLDFDNPKLLERKVHSLDLSRTFYVYCKSENQIQTIGKWLIREGVNQVYFLDGGIKAWEDANLPINY